MAEFTGWKAVAEQALTAGKTGLIIGGFVTPAPEAQTTTIQPQLPPEEATIAVLTLTPAVRDRARGALLGLAVGDALGTTLEFEPRDDQPLHTEMLGGGPFSLAPGQWTDDTAMALALADSLLAGQGFDPQDLATRFVSWWRQGSYSCTGQCFDIGHATAEALARFEVTGEPFAGSADPLSAGNGSIMRLAPAVLFSLRQDAGAADQLAMAQGRITHAAEQCRQACSLLAVILRDAIRGKPHPLRPRLRDGDPLIDKLALGTYRAKSRDQIRSSGSVVHTLEAALWAVSQTENFEAALVLAVNLGEDADTVGAVTGQLAGALYGASAIPQRWLEPLAWRDRRQQTRSSQVPSPARAEGQPRIRSSSCSPRATHSRGPRLCAARRDGHAHRHAFGRDPRPRQIAFVQRSRWQRSRR
ncbi:ADP-ribosylglycohydrolase family protein [Methylobacterium nigriterrae]|uniref:ADP-ribosylglycohydrolase family protein n=1 Tax=Methylobacterium nigriterrae TaxID=3127512 RepID=UPI00301411B8